jgi:hypothetical protein
VHDLGKCDRRWDMRSIASEVGIISFNWVHEILTDVYDMSKVSAWWVPRQLTDDQKRTKLEVEGSMITAVWTNLRMF